MQVETRTRGVVAEMQKGLFKVVDDLQREAVAVNVQQIKGDYITALRVSLDQFRKVKYYKDTDPELRNLPPGPREIERTKMNMPAREVIKVIKHCKDNPRVTGEELTQLRRTVFRNFPPTLDITVIPLLIAWGECFSGLVEIQKALRFDAEEEPEDSIAKAPK
jgi:hypothetical protein